MALMSIENKYKQNFMWGGKIDYHNRWNRTETYLQPPGKVQAYTQSKRGVERLESITFCFIYFWKGSLILIAD